MLMLMPIGARSHVAPQVFYMPASQKARTESCFSSKLYSHIRLLSCLHISSILHLIGPRCVFTGVLLSLCLACSFHLLLACLHIKIPFLALLLFFQPNVGPPGTLFLSPSHSEEAPSRSTTAGISSYQVGC